MTEPTPTYEADLAARIGAYYTALVDQGLPSHLVENLVIGYHHALMERDQHAVGGALPPPSAT